MWTGQELSALKYFLSVSHKDVQQWAQTSFNVTLMQVGHHLKMFYDSQTYDYLIHYNDFAVVLEENPLKGTYHAKSTFLALKCILLYIWNVYKYRKDEIILFRWFVYIFIFCFGHIFQTCSDFHFHIFQTVCMTFFEQVRRRICSGTDK